MIRNVSLFSVALSFSAMSFADIDISATNIELTPPALTTTALSTTSDTTTPKKDPNTTYTIEYAEQSTIKDVPLDNAALTIKVYYNGNPMGFDAVATDANKEFTFDKYKDTKLIAIEVTEIGDQNKYKARCYGNTDPDKPMLVKINCVKKS